MNFSERINVNNNLTFTRQSTEQRTGELHQNGIRLKYSFGPRTRTSSMSREPALKLRSFQVDQESAT